MNSTTFFNDIRDSNGEIKNALNAIGNFIAEYGVSAKLSEFTGQTKPTESTESTEPTEPTVGGGKQHTTSRKRHRILGTKWSKSNE